MSSESYLIQAGQTKAERLFQENFVLTDKETGIQIIREHGPNAFAMWWYLQSLCYGKDKAHAFPKIETIAKGLGTSTRTVERWIKQLKDIKALRVVNCYLASGMQTINLYVLNNDFPDVPEWFDQIYPYGAIKIQVGKKVRFAERAKPRGKDETPEELPPTNLSAPPNQWFDEPDHDEPSNEGGDKNVGAEMTPPTNLSGAENQDSENDAPENPSNEGDDKNVGGEKMPPTNLSGRVEAPNPDGTRAEGLSSGGEEYNSFIKNISIDDDDRGSAPNSPSWENDSQYKDYRNLFLRAGADDIVDHEQNYPKFLSAVEEAGGFYTFMSCAEWYVKQFKDGNTYKDHESPQIMWLIGGGWKSVSVDMKKKPQAPKQPKKAKKPESGDKLPRAVANQMAGERVATKTPEELEEQKRRTQEKLRIMKERLDQRKREEEEERQQRYAAGSY